MEVYDLRMRKKLSVKFLPQVWYCYWCQEDKKIIWEEYGFCVDCRATLLYDEA